MSASTSVGLSGPPLSRPQADMVVPARPPVMARRRKTSETLERNAGWDRAVAWSAL